MNICIFGDSITEGYYDEEKNGWVNRLKAIFSDDEICNLGISGDSTEDLLKRFDADIKDKNPEMIIFAIGTNDSVYLPAEKRNYVDFNKFNENLKTLIEKSRQFTSNIVFVGLTPVDESLTKPIPWEIEMHYTNEEIGKYNKAIRQICEDEKLKFIDIFDDLASINYKEMLSDGLHPNAVGHEWMANKIAKELK
ncbi:MAG: gdsl-family lipolytic enzyme [Candidatus Moranbacteria bacterium GW2011_GWE2_35_2-]|nr:MAG: gdsl-family lipolytic enzyme [Candidatus Moranbacteria bacterium GW2011_GWE2_35_2-]KKQ22045.1 MAG: gdsl-family lipolytic enzyme [Candidatus Moranbacteria bacterium GW2011_GWF2_37_11]KKQ29201.1 MAG: gdsl-family lipolytic enzyme [Candidatus Moranbacteria bacterium GW2011_GWD1_37_17]KKQ31186.1 MAG: gdsl-family lipolytic enzyme [Candidatus Moranbacteria bacterium GW2011_GWE1_37_24]KKQ47436.1 MAG: gdsl-family lipolytic enzyme [Candidatus Moranbacteria bacterium GW2011_GWD2_37_9]HBO16417.1 h